MKLKRFEEIASKYFKKGPSARYLDDIKRYRVHYRTRPWGEQAEWTKHAIEMTVRSEQDARLRTIKQCRERVEVEVTRVEFVSAEAPIQTGQSVQTVSQATYEELEEQKKESLREMGLWVP